jgi:antibiotic biosynthesis monooxygenase (ABM) superfamily enzyme
MTVFLVEAYVIKPEKQTEFTAYKKKWKKFFACKEGHLETFKEVKSYKMFSQMLGASWGGYVEIWEFDNLANLEKFFNKIMKSEYMTKLAPEFASLEVPATRSMNIWNSVPGF